MDLTGIYLVHVVISRKSQQEKLQRDKKTIRIYFPIDKISMFTLHHAVNMFFMKRKQCTWATGAEKNQWLQASEISSGEQRFHNRGLWNRVKKKGSRRGIRAKTTYNWRESTKCLLGMTFSETNSSEAKMCPCWPADASKEAYWCIRKV